MEFGAVFVLLFAVATGVAIVARRFKIPYTVALVVAGLLLGAVHALHPPHLTKELLYTVFLPGLLFEAAFHLELRHFLENRIVITLLAVPGVVVAIGLTAALLTPAVAALRFADGFTLKHGLVFAALIAATDPIAVVALFKTLGAPKRLAVIVEGESLLNDGTAIVLFTIILAAVSGGSSSIGGAALDFVRVVGVGALAGAAIGYSVSRVIQRIDEPMIEITLTTIAAYGSFVAAEHVHGSGVIATVVAGMICGNYAASTGMSPTTRIAVESFWEYLAFALNSMVFLLIGFELRIEALLSSYRPILIAFTAVTLGRAAVIALVSLPLRKTAERLPWNWSAVLTWGGLRGGLSMVLVLGLDPTFPFRDLLVTMTFGVVLISILLQGLTMAPLLRRLGVVGGRKDREEYEIQRGAHRALSAAFAALDTMVREGRVHAEAEKHLRRDYDARLAEADRRIRAIHLTAGNLLEEELGSARRQLLQVEKQALRDEFHRGALGQHALEALERDLDARIVDVERVDARSDTAEEASK